MNFICLPLMGLDVILWMYWLTTKHILIDCRQHKVMLLDVARLELSSVQGILKEINDGATCFTVIAQEKKKSVEEQIIGIPVVEEYANVFLDEVSGLPPSRVVDFAVDLVTGPSLISMAPCRMALTKLTKLKK